MADDRGVSVATVTGAIDGYDLTTDATESPARKVAAGEADAGLALRATAEKLDLEFVPLGTERVRVLANRDRTEKESVEGLGSLLGELDDLAAALAGFEA